MVRHFEALSCIKMNSKSLAPLLLLASFTATLPVWAKTTTWTELTSPLTEDTTVTACGSITVNDTIDLAGHKLYLEGLTGLSGSGTFTDSTTDTQNPGELHLILSADFSSSAVGLTGNLRLVKSGSKTLTMAYSSTSYKGGNIISNGTLKIGTTSQTLANFKPLGAGGGHIDIYPQGTLDTNGKYNFSGVYDVNMYGGKIETSTTKASTSQLFNPRMTVYVDSEYHLGSGKTYTLAGNIDLKENVLKANLDGGTTANVYPTEIKNGTIRYEGSGTFNLSKTFDMRTVNFDEAGTKLALGGFKFSISNYVSNLSTARTGTIGEIDVYGALIPNTDHFFPPTMQNGSTIDLSAKEGTWTSTVAGAIEAIKYAENATVNINVGSRTVKEGDKLIAWDKSDLSGLSFKLVGEKVTEDLSLTIAADGISVTSSDTQVTDAEWTGAGNDSDINNTANWKCTTAGGKVIADTLPDGNIVVTIPYNKLKEINCSPDAPLTCKHLDFSGEKPTGAEQLPAARDWRGLGDIDFLFPIDLNGYDLKISLKGKTATDTTPFVTNSSPTAATLFASVPAGETYDNQSVAFGGNLTFVKEGAGRFVATFYPQKYAGLTIVSNGVLKCKDNANLNESEGDSPFGAQQTVDVAPNGILDPAGSYYWGRHTINLQGGMISNTVARNGMSSDGYNAANRGLLFNPTINLSAPSVFAVHGAYNYQGSLNCNGHELELWAKSGSSLRWCPTASANAILRVTGNGSFYTLKNFPVNEKTLSLTMDGLAFFHMGGSLSISNYTAKSTVNSFDYENNASPTMMVYGTFTPVADHFAGCTMQNNSVIDLSEHTNSIWSTQGFTWGKGTVDFAKNAKVTIDVSGRTFTKKTQIVEWAPGSTNGLETVTFKLDAASKAAGYSLFYKPYVDANDKGGLWVGRKGLVFIIQ